MAYQAILSGATTLSFYHYRPEEWAQTPGFHDAFVGLMKELTQFSRRFAAASVESTMTQSGILESIVTLPSHETIRIRVNTNRRVAEGLDALAIEEATLRAGPGLAAGSDDSSRKCRDTYRQRCGRFRRLRRSSRLCSGDRT